MTTVAPRLSSWQRLPVKRPGALGLATLGLHQPGQRKSCPGHSPASDPPTCYRLQVAGDDAIAVAAGSCAPDAASTVGRLPLRSASRCGGVPPPVQTAAGAEGRRLGAEELLAPIKDSFTRGALFRLRVQDLFEAVSDRFQSSGVEILVPSDASTEFLIGDTPTLPVDLTTGTAGLQAGVSLGDANTIMLPLAARLPVSLGRTTAIAQVPSRFVDQVNRVQALVQVPWAPTARRHHHDCPS